MSIILIRLLVTSWHRYIDKALNKKQNWRIFFVVLNCVQCTSSTYFNLTVKGLIVLFLTLTHMYMTVLAKRDHFAQNFNSQYEQLKNVNSIHLYTISVLKCRGM